PGPSDRSPGASLQDACSLLTPRQVATIFGSVEPAGDTPSATHQSNPSVCVWGTGVTTAQESGDPGAVSAVLEVSYHVGSAGPVASAQKFVLRGCATAREQVPGVGDTAYYCGGNMAAVQGRKLVEFQCFSISPDPTASTEAQAITAALAILRVGSPLGAG
ncbi:MAG: hypothetical protein WA809_06580, partial [Candidatus Dormiibacterota bacterium]